MSRVRGDGSILPREDKPRSKCRKWQLQVSIGRDLATGKYVRRTRNFSGTYSEAKHAMREFIDEIDCNRSIARSADRVKDYSDAWIERRKSEVEHGTWRKNVDHLKCINMHIGDARFHELTFAVIEKMYDDLRAGKSPSGKKLSGTYVGNIARTLHKMLQDAIKDGKIASNPCDLAKAPANDTEEKKSMTLEQMRELDSKLDPTHPQQLVLKAGFKDGICRGEMHGLRCGNIGDGEVSIEWTVDETGIPKEKCKTLYRKRKHPISPSLMADFEARLAYMKENGIPTGPEDPIICNEAGEYMLPSATTLWWRRHRDDLGFPGWTPHEMRHSFASQMVRNKVDPKVLQKWLGHSQFSTTMDIYVHVNDAQFEEARDTINW